MEEELRFRLARIQSALGKTVGIDATQVRPIVYATEKRFGMILNFGGTESQEEVANAAQSLISNIAHLKDYLKDWLSHQGGNPGGCRAVRQWQFSAANCHRPLQHGETS